MANNPSHGRYISERTIYETLVGGQSHIVPKYEEAVKDPKPAMYCSYAAPVEKNPFVDIPMLITPPRDATQEALNQYAREGYLRQALDIDKRVQEREILQQSTEAQVSALVSDEYERRRAVRRGVYEATGMTPSEIDEKFAQDALRGSEYAVTRATTDKQVNDALIRYFQLRGAVVPAFLQPPAPAPSTNTAMGDSIAPADGLPLADEDGVPVDAPIPTYDQYDAEEQAETQVPAEPLPRQSASDFLTPREEAEMEAALSMSPPPTSYYAGLPTKALIVRWMKANGFPITGVRGTELSESSIRNMSWSSLFDMAKSFSRQTALPGPAQPPAPEGGETSGAYLPFPEYTGSGGGEK